MPFRLEVRILWRLCSVVAQTPIDLVVIVEQRDRDVSVMNPDAVAAEEVRIAALSRCRLRIATRSKTRPGR